MAQLPDAEKLASLAEQIKVWGRELGFAELAITDIDLQHAEPYLENWLELGYHGDMHYMASHGLKRARPAELVPGTVRVISARMNYLTQDILKRQRAPGEAVISVYAHGRDYHKVLKQRLQQLAEKVAAEIGPYGFRVFTDSAPVMEVALAAKAGLGWRGKHTLLISRQAGSMFFLGEILIDLPLPVDQPVTSHCGACQSCIEVCPTQAIVAPFKLDARRCVSYLTIELDGSIPEDLRPLIGNRVYGCDDCQLHCPWNKFAQLAAVDDFAVRNGLDSASMLSLFSWDEAEFLRRMEGSAIRRIGHERWLRNLAVGLGNAAAELAGDAAIINALRQRLQHPSAMVREHVLWALAQHGCMPDAEH